MDRIDNLFPIIGNLSSVTLNDDLPAALKYADEIAVLSEGKLAAVGTPASVYESGILDQVFGVKVKRIQGGFYYAKYLAADC